jgi:D-Tyr-tRNAtyr deacylase
MLHAGAAPRFFCTASSTALGLTDIGAGLLLVPQFTLAADTRKGMRPSLTPAADPSVGERLFAYLGEHARARHPIVCSRPFRAVDRHAMARNRAG